MGKRTTGWLGVVLALGSADSMLAHHSLANYDTAKAVRVKGTIVEFHPINPHSFLFLDETGADGQTRHWAVEGPSIVQLKRTNFATDVLKPGPAIESCGYVPKENTVWQMANPDPTKKSLSGRLINAETMVMSDGKQQSWGDYGVHKCFAEGYTDQHPAK